MDGSLINWSMISTMLRPAMQAEIAKLPPEVQAAFHDTAAYITQEGNRIDLEIRFAEGNETADKVKDFVLSNLMSALPEVVKILGGRALIRK